MSYIDQNLSEIDKILSPGQTAWDRLPETDCLGTKYMSPGQTAWDRLPETDCLGQSREMTKSGTKLEVKTEYMQRRVMQLPRYAGPPGCRWIATGPV